MSSVDWGETTRIFDAALEIEPARRAAFLRAECGGDRSLEDRVQSLLGHADRASEDGFLRPAAWDVDAVLGFVTMQVGKVLVDDLVERSWEVLQVLHGGMGFVYVVREQITGQSFALKSFLPCKDPDLQRRLSQRFVEEVAVWMNLGDQAYFHPNIVEAIFVLRIWDQPFVLMRYIEGGDLGRRIGELDLAHVLAYSFQICDSMMHARFRGIMVHGDLKPQNCLLEGEWHLRISDFGLARAFDGVLDGLDSAWSRDEATGSIGGVADYSGTRRRPGTPAYMAPEAFDPVASPDVRADVYSFGVMLFEMLTGRKPFVVQPGSGVSLYEAYATLHRDGDAEPPDFDAPHPALEAIVARCLAKNPYARYLDFFEVRDALGFVFRDLTGRDASPSRSGKQWLAEIADHLDLDLSESRELIMKTHVMLGLGHYEEGLAWAERRLESQPDDPCGWGTKAQFLRYLGHHDEALGCYDRALALDAGDIDALGGKGATLAALGRHEEALAWLDRALALDPAYVSVLYDKANCLQSLGRTVEAIEHFDMALERNPQHRMTLVAKGELLALLYQDEEAASCLQKALDVQPNDASTWINLAAIRFRQENFREAVECYDRALAIDPKQIRALIGKADILILIAESGKSSRRSANGSWHIAIDPRLVQEAIDLCDQALALDPRSAWAWYVKSLAYFAVYQFDVARDCYDRAFEIEPTGIPAWPSSVAVIRSSPPDTQPDR